MPTGLSELGPEQLDRMTDTMTDAEISAQFGLSRTAATHARNRYGIRSFAEKHGQRKYKEYYEPKPNAQRVFSLKRMGVNTRYFESLTSPSQAYWLGLLLADGWIVTEHDDPRGFAIALHVRDKKLLDQFAQDLGYSGLVKPERAGSRLLQIKVSSVEMANNLISLGMPPRKSKILEIPELKKDLMPHLVRGYFDGDGHVGIRGNSLTVQFTSGSLAALERLLFHLRSEAGARMSIHHDRNAYVLRAYAGHAIKTLAYMYGTHGEYLPAMERKLQKFHDYLESDAGRSWRRLLSREDSASSR